MDKLISSSSLTTARAACKLSAVRLCLVLLAGMLVATAMVTPHLGQSAADVDAVRSENHVPALEPAGDSSAPVSESESESESESSDDDSSCLDEGVALASRLSMAPLPRHGSFGPFALDLRHLSADAEPETPPPRS